MALDFLSAPGLIILHYYYYSFRYFMSIFLASSVDPERAFSGGEPFPTPDGLAACRIVV